MRAEPRVHICDAVARGVSRKRARCSDSSRHSGAPRSGEPGIHSHKRSLLRRKSSTCLKHNHGLRSPRNDDAREVANSTRRANHQFLSSHNAKYILLYRNTNRGHNSCRPVPTEGRFAIVTIRRAQDAMDAVASGDFSPDENACSGRRSRVVLTPRPWRQADGAIHRPRGQERPLPRGEPV